jgi:nicotinamidase-related amidase
MTALLLIDFQNDYFENGTNTLVNPDKACNNARLILDRFRQQTLAVIHIQHIATKPTATFFLPDTFGAEINEKVKPLETEKLCIKHYPNSFRDTDLLEHIQKTGITELVVCGMMTHMCVDATTRAAKDYGLNCIVIADACATKDLEILGQKVKAEDVQTSFIAALNYFYSSVTTTSQYLQ